MKIPTLIGCLSSLAIAACAAFPHSQEIPRSSSSSSSPDTVIGTWDFSVTSASTPQHFGFALTSTPADTCLSGAWYEARPISVPNGVVSRPAYHYESGKLEILLSTELCDGYTSFIGNVSGSKFDGSYISYGLGGSTEHGKVTGSQRP
jgi:hypothetical protein